MRSLVVDPERRRIHAQPGRACGGTSIATQVHGLAAPAGVVSRTGVAGLAVGGGFGWLSRRWGLTSDNVVAMDVLLADGTRGADGRRRAPGPVLGHPRGRRQLRDRRPGSSSSCTSSGPRSWRGRCSTRWTVPARSCSCTGRPSRTPRASSRSCGSRAPPRRSVGAAPPARDRRPRPDPVLQRRPGGGRGGPGAAPHGHRAGGGRRPAQDLRGAPDDVRLGGASRAGATTGSPTTSRPSPTPPSTWWSRTGGRSRRPTGYSAMFQLGGAISDRPADYNASSGRDAAHA